MSWIWTNTRSQRVLLHHKHWQQCQKVRLSTCQLARGNFLCISSPVVSDISPFVAIFQIDMKNFPFDEQTCHFKFGSWTYDGNKLDLTFYESLVDLDTREYIESSEWMILSTRAQHNIRFYPCCQNEPYPDLTFYLTIKRRTAFYIYVLILPSVLLSCLTLVLFWIPPQRPDRTSLGK